MTPHKYGVAKAADRTREGVTYRSRAEMHYSVRLGLLMLATGSERVVSWEYEPKRYPLVCGVNNVVVAHYTPDFRVEYADGRVELVEIKGHALPTGQLKIVMFRACYPDLVLRVLDSNTLRERTPTQRPNLLAKQPPASRFKCFKASAKP